MSLLVAYVVVALGTSFLCSILEAVLLATRDSDLAARTDRGAALLYALKRERIDDAISAILTLNTIAHTIGAAMAGAQAVVVFGEAWVGAFSAVLTLLILVLTEIIPKTLGAVHAPRLVGFVGRTLQVLVVVLTPALVLTRLLTRLLVRRRREVPVSGREVLALAAVAAQQGTVQKDLTRALANLMRVDEVRVYDVMTPRTVAWMLPADATIAELLADPQHRVFSRLPLYGASPDEVEGYLVVREVLSDAARARARDTPLSSYRRTVHFVPEIIGVGTLLHRMIEWREHIAIAVDEFGGVSGVVTMEDAIETLLGKEILDELDRVEDMRRVASEMRERRMRRHERLASREPS